MMFIVKLSTIKKIQDMDCIASWCPLEHEKVAIGTQMPTHQFADCCGFFTDLREEGLFCNECGVEISSEIEKYGRDCVTCVDVAEIIPALKLLQKYLNEGYYIDWDVYAKHGTISTLSLYSRNYCVPQASGKTN